MMNCSRCVWPKKPVIVTAASTLVATRCVRVVLRCASHPSAKKNAPPCVRKRVCEALSGVAPGETVLLDREITEADIEYVVVHVGSFGDDNRAGIERWVAAHRVQPD